MKFPDPIDLRIDEIDDAVTLRNYMIERTHLHTRDSYAGAPMSKFPEDLRVYEHLLWEMHADTVIEIGCHFGGSSMWFRDRLATFASYRPNQLPPSVIAVDIDLSPARNHLDSQTQLNGLEFVEGDVRDAEVIDQIRSHLRPGSRPLVVEDSAHEFSTTYAALEGCARFVPVGGFFVVEDGVVDLEWARLSEAWPRGVRNAIEQWLGTPDGSRFEVRRDLEIYGLTCHPGGILMRESID